MSVHAKDRNETATQYVVTAQSLQIETIKYLMNENRIGKKWRFILVQDAILKVSELLDNTVAANATFPSNEEKLADRKKYMQKALVNCYQLQNKLLTILRVIPDKVTADSMKNVTSLLLDEVRFIRSAYQNAKVIGKQKV